METARSISALIQGSFADAAATLGAFLPHLLGAALLLGLSWPLARLLRVLTVRGVHALERLLLRWRPLRGIRRPTLLVFTEVIGSVVFWVVILFFVATAAQVLGLEVVSQWLGRIAGYLPTLFAGTLIVIAGFLVSALVRDVVVATAPVAPAKRTALGTAAQLVILVTSIVIGADQVGIDVTFLIIVMGLLLAAVLGTLGLAVGLGARVYVANLIAAHHLRQTYRVGQIVRIGEDEGPIIELSAVALVIDTPRGQLTLPAARFLDQPTLLIDGQTAEKEAPHG